MSDPRASNPAILPPPAGAPVRMATGPAGDTVEALQRAHTQMLAALNHEIRTPLTGILGMSDLLLESSLTSEQREYVQSSRMCAESLLESVANALEYASVTAGQLKLSAAPFHLQEVIRTAASAMQSRAESRGILLNVINDNGESETPEVVIGDALRLRQVISILLSNALNACVQDEVTVAVSTFFSSHDRRLTLTISIGDNGMDLPPGRLRHLFDAPEFGGYNQARLELGLPLAYQIVLAMGGSLEAESIRGSGTLITASFPLRLPGPTAEYAVRSAATAPVRPQILLVEDNDVAQRFMRTVLERKGYDVRIAPSGFDAIEAVSIHEFDLVIMDVQMPEMDGLECTRQIRLLPHGKSVPIVACTANTAFEVRNSCLESGMDDFLSKPVHTSELIEITARYLAGR